MFSITDGKFISQSYPSYWIPFHTFTNQSIRSHELLKIHSNTKKKKPIATWKFTSSNSPPILTSSPHDPLHSISSRYTLPRYRWARPLQVYYLCQPRTHTSLSPSPQHCRGSCLSTYIFDDLNGARRVSRFRARPCTRVCFLKKQSPWRGKTFRPPAHRRPFSSPACCLYTHACRGVRLPLKARVKE